MSKFAVVPNPYKDPEHKITKEIVKILSDGGISADVVTEYHNNCLEGYDCAVVLGGDGTIR